MNVYTCYFSGHFPVGAVATIIAKDIYEALDLMKDSLKKEGLLDDNLDLSVDDFEEVDTTTPQAIILLDGDY